MVEALKGWDQQYQNALVCPHLPPLICGAMNTTPVEKW